MKKLIAITSLAAFLLLPAVSLAAGIPPGGGGIPTACSSFISCITNIQNPNGLVIQTNQYQGLPGQIVNLFLPVILTIAGFIAVIFIVISGIQFITSSGNPEAANAARGRLIYALIGFGIIVLAFAILQIINTIFLGTSLV